MRVADFVLSHDLAPSVLDFLGVDHPPMQGTSFMPLIRGEAQARRDHVVTGWAGGGNEGPRAAVRTADWAYSCNCADANLDELLFDLGSDPGETHNVASRRPEIVALRRAELKAYLGRLPYTGTRFFPATASPPAMAHRLWKAGEIALR